MIEPRNETTKNRFIEFMIDYHKYLEDIKEDYCTSGGKSLKKKWFFFDNAIYTIPESLESTRADLLDRYNEINLALSNTNCKIIDWLYMVREFIDFLNLAESSTLFTNDSDSYLYIECDNKHSTYNLRYYNSNEDITYRISFMDTELKPIGSNNSSIQDFINGTTSESVTLIQIDIIRDYGDKKQNQIKLMNNASSIEALLDTKEDLFTFNIFRDIISTIMKMEYFGIIKNLSYVIGVLPYRNILDEVLHGYIEVSE